MKYVYIDESGETGRSSKYIIFASIETESPRPLEKAIKKIWRVKPQLHAQGELHAHTADDSTRKRVLYELIELDILINFVIIRKSSQRRPLNDVYYQKLADMIAKNHSDAHVIVIDKKDTNKKRIETINRLELQKVFSNVSFQESYSVKQLQAVDFVAWSLGRFYEQGDSEFMDLITSKINTDNIT
ncbi:MAG TPA: DUF3800 domain-containing protein [Candidatus Saccharibacteria bacterium]|nr:DUF3800 domain-containing protein [Candidatus Saccharibacteria bacterium]HRQ97983.1 DUF3800 domain-containing protein [Candidatus Saccharibacteria bacterium]